MRRGVLPVAVASVAVTAAACGTTNGNTHDNAAGGSNGDAAQKSPVKVVEAAYTKTTDARTAHVTIKEQIAAHLSGGTDQQTSVTARGVVNFAHRSADITASTAQGSVEARTLNGMLYIKVPASERDAVGGTPWAKVDLNKVAKAKTGASLSQLTGATPTDPRQQLAYLRGVSDQVKKVGTATIGGVTTTHYRATVDLDKAAKQDTAGQHAINRVEQQLGSRTLPMDAWIDNQGRLRQAAFIEHIRHLAASGGAGGGSATIKITETLSHFGVNASVKAPSPGQTTDVTNKVLAASGK